nr:MAG TPA: hypothetical protein [Caudoviricetes sp.]
MICPARRAFYQHVTAHSPRIPISRSFTKATSENAIAAWCARVWPFW